MLPIIQMMQGAAAEVTPLTEETVADEDKAADVVTDEPEAGEKEK